MAAKVKALQAWCKAQCDGYRDVNITNMTSSWKSGLAFCAMIHRYRPDLIDYDSLSKENVFDNNQLAFEVAERELNIPALLDAEDMVAMAVPDKLCIVTYVSQYYNHLANKEKLGGPGVKGKTGVKRALPSTDAPSESKKALTTQAEGSAHKAASRRGSTLTDVCAMCKQKVYVMERHMDGSKLYHRRCIREQQRSLPRKPANETNRKPANDSPRNPANESKFFNLNKQSTDKELSGKENRKPPTVTSQWTSSTTKPSIPIETRPNVNSSSSHLLNKIHGSPKPYSSAAISSDVKPPSTNINLSKSSVPKINAGYSSLDLGLSDSTDRTSSQEKPKFTARFYGNKKENPLLKPLTKQTPPAHQEPMDTSTNHEKYQIVGQVVNKPYDYASGTTNKTEHVVTAKTFAGSQPMNANVTQTKVNKMADTTSDSQVLQGLLKNLAGVRSKQNVSNGQDVTPAVHTTAKRSTASPSKSEEAPAFTKVVLKPATKPDTTPAIPTRPPPSLLTPGAHAHSSNETVSTENNKMNQIPKPKQRQSKLISDQEKLSKGLSTAESNTPKFTYSPKPILKSTETKTDISETKKFSPKPILKNAKESITSEKTDKQVPVMPHVNTPYTPPLSVFKTTDNYSLLSRFDLDSSGEHENNTDSSQTVKRPCVIPVMPPRPSTAPVGVKKDLNINSKDKTPLVSANISPENKPKSHTKSPPKTAWQIELQARQGIRAHEPLRTDLNSNTRNAADTNQVNKASGTSSGVSKPEWQREAEKRQAQRQIEEQNKHSKLNLDISPDSAPVAPPRRKAPPRPTSPPKLHSHTNYATSPTSPPFTAGGPSYGGLDVAELVKKQTQNTSPKSSSDNEESPNYLRASVTSDQDPFGRTSKVRGSGPVARKPAFRMDDKQSNDSGNNNNGNIPSVANSKLRSDTKQADEAPSWIAEAQKRNAARNGVYLEPEHYPHHNKDQTDQRTNPEPKRKIMPDTRFTFSYDFDAQHNEHRNESVDALQPSPRPGRTDMRNRPLPEVPKFSPPKRRVNAEERMAMHEIIEQLEHLDAALQILEHDGRELEDSIRLGTDDDMDDGALMVQWFEVVNQKNELVRKETDLMFKKKQQELEDEHEDIEYELRCLLEKPEHLKTPSEKVREESLLQELMDTVSLRNSIVDCIEENRIKYIEEDKEIAQVMASKGFCKAPVPNEPEKTQKIVKKKKGKKNNGKEKRKSNGINIENRNGH